MSSEASCCDVIFTVILVFGFLPVDPFTPAKLRQRCFQYFYYSAAFLNWQLKRNTFLCIQNISYASRIK